MAENELRKYRVISPLLADGKNYKVGARIELPAEYGESLVSLGVLEPAKTTKDKEE